MNISNILAGYGFSNKAILEVDNNYNAPNRHYHDYKHLKEMLEFVYEYNKVGVSKMDYELLQIAIIFHDVIYNPLSKTNELESARMAVKYLPARYDKQIVSNLIMATQKHEFTAESPLLEKIMILADLDRFNAHKFSDVWQHTIDLFKEFYMVDYADYKRGRAEFLEGYKLKIKSMLGDHAAANVGKIITALEVWNPRIAVYPGSFNPFHKGHLNILEKGKKIFDKVIVARGPNPDKSNVIVPLPEEIITTHQVDTYEGMLTDYINTKEYDLTVIRGLRNSTDLAYELNQYRNMQELDTDINVISFFCDYEYEHVSSSACRTFQKFGKHYQHIL